MVDTYGRWYKEGDYSNYPKEKWCDMDYVAAYLDALGYKPKHIGYEELILRLIQTYEEDIHEHASECGEDMEYYAIEDPDPDNHFIYIPDFAAWLSDVGELEDFDYQA